MKKANAFYEDVMAKWLAIDEFEQLEQEIVESLKLASQCKTQVSASERTGKEAHPGDVEFAERAMTNAIDLAKHYTEKAIRENPSKLATLAKVVDDRHAPRKQESKPKLIVGKMLLDFLKVNDRLPASRTELLDSASDDCRADIAELGLKPAQLFTRGLEYYGVAKIIQDKRGRKS